MKNHLIKYSVIFIFLVLFISCRKYNYETTCAGVVIDYTTSEPIPGATVYLGRGISNFSGTDYQTIATVKSDSHGKFNFKFMAEKTGNYFVLAKGALWYLDNEIHEKIEIEKGKRASKKQQNVQIMMKPIGILKLTINKTDNSYYYLDARTNVYLCSCIAQGTVVNTTCISVPIQGGSNFDFSVDVNKYDSGYNLISYSKFNYQVFCKARDTTNYIINY